jgi:hypothetical protein
MYTTTFSHKAAQPLDQVQLVHFEQNSDKRQVRNRLSECNHIVFRARSTPVAVRIRQGCGQAYGAGAQLGFLL